MKALTVQQPWAWAIFRGKNIENRTQLWRYRGPLAIHAGMRESERGMADRRIRHQTALDGIIGPLHFGAVLGTVDLVDVHPDAGCCRPWGESGYVEHGGRERRSVTHLVLENAVLLDRPFSWPGALGLWNLPDEVLEP